MADVFISFIHEEEKAAYAVQRVLKHMLQASVFISADEWAVFAGDVWLDRIREELTEAKVVVLMLSAQSVARPWINFEAGGAWLAKKPVIPACYGGLTSATLPKPYSGMQALNLPNDLYYLYSSVLHHLKPNDMAAPPFPPSSFAYRCVEAGIAGTWSSLPPDQSWTDAMTDEAFRGRCI